MLHYDARRQCVRSPLRKNPAASFVGGGCFHITLDAADLQLNKRSFFFFLNCKTFSPLIQAVYMYLSDGSYFTKRLSHKVSQIHDANDIFYDKLID